MRAIGNTLIFALLMASGCKRSALPTPAPGTAIVELAVVAEPKTGAPAADPGDRSYVTPVMQRVDYSALDDVVVWIEPVKGSAGAVPAVAIDIDPSSAPAKLAAVAGVGATVQVRNRGTAPADLFSVSDGNDFDLGRIAPAASATFTIKSAGLIEILSDAVRDPVARIYAAPSPLVRLTSAGQTVEFRDLPPGKYRAVTWHPRLPGHSIDLDLTAGQVTSATVKVSVNGLAQIGP